jgi:hypothetical protein
MTDINKIIQVNITREDQNISQEGFGILLGMAPLVAFTDYTKSYSNLTEVGEDFPTDSKVYFWAEKVFSQNPRVPELKVGRRQVDSVDIEITTILNDTAYKIWINDVLFSYTSDSDATALEIAANMVNIINLGGEPVTAVDNTDGTYTLNTDVGGVAFSVKLDQYQTLDQSSLIPAYALVNDVQDLQEVDHNWYVITEFEYIEAEQKSLAAYIETQEKLYAVFDDDVDLVLADFFKNSDYDRTFIMHTRFDNPNSDYIESAWCGKQLPTDPGSTTWANKILNAIQADNYDSGVYDNILAKNANLYTVFSDVERPLTREGTVSSGEYIDIMRGIDWFTARLRERLFLLLSTSPKIPYTNHGIALVEAQVKAQILDGIAENLIDGERDTYYVTAPKVADINPNDRINRILRDVEFQWRAAGAIHTLIVNGRVTF